MSTSVEPTMSRVIENGTERHRNLIGHDESDHPLLTPFTREMPNGVRERR